MRFITDSVVDLIRRVSKQEGKDFLNFVANVPYIKCYVKKEYLYDLDRGHGEFEECVLIAVKSMQGRALMFEAYIPAYGACFDKFPLSAFVWRTDIVLSLIHI